LKRVIGLMASIFVTFFLVGMICTAQLPIVPIHSPTLSECESGYHFDLNAGTCVSDDNQISDDSQVSDDGEVYDNQTLLGYATPKFKIGDHVQATNNINVRDDPGTISGIITTLPKGSTGVVQNGPVHSVTRNYWTIQYDNGPTGWSSENLLQLVNGDTVTGSIIYLSDLKPYESEFDETLYDSQASLIMGGKPYSKGIRFKQFYNGAKSVYFNLNGKYSRLKGHIGMNDGSDIWRSGKISVLIQGDGNDLNKLDLKPGDLPASVNIDVKGVHQIKIEFSKDVGNGQNRPVYYDLVA